MWPIMTSTVAEPGVQGQSNAVKEEIPAASDPIGEPPVEVEEKTGPSFMEEVLKSPGGEGVRLCIQCGVCSSSCPNIARMDYSPRKTISMIRAERQNEVLSSNSPWICASCYMCTVRCPRGVKPTEIMHVLEDLVPIVARGIRDFLLYLRNCPLAVPLALKMLLKKVPHALLKRQTIRRYRRVPSSYIRGLIR